MTTSSKGMCFSGLFAGHKGTEGYLRLTEKLLCEQRWNLSWPNRANTSFTLVGRSRDFTL